MIKFNPTGTHIKNRLLKVRLDIYIDDPTGKTYGEHYIQVPTEPLPDDVDDKDGNIIQAKFDQWWATVPKIWRLNPALCHFVTVPETVELADLQEYVARLFDADTVATLDNALVQLKSADLIAPYMKAKRPFSTEKVVSKDYADLIIVVNKRLGILSVPLADGGGRIEPLNPRSIDIGAGATDRGSRNLAPVFTTIDLNNPANATGSIDTFEIWFEVTAGDATNAVMGALFGSGGTWESRDSETLGAVTAGSKQTFSGLDCDVETNDNIGLYYESTARIESDVSGGAGVWYKSGNQFGQGEQSGYTEIAGDIFSLYGTGTEAGWTGEYCGVAVDEFDGVTPDEIDGV